MTDKKKVKHFLVGRFDSRLKLPFFIFESPLVANLANHRDRVIQGWIIGQAIGKKPNRFVRAPLLAVDLYRHVIVRTRQDACMEPGAGPYCIYVRDIIPLDPTAPERYVDGVIVNGVRNQGVGIAANYDESADQGRVERRSRVVDEMIAMRVEIYGVSVREGSRIRSNDDCSGSIAEGTVPARKYTDRRIRCPVIGNKPAHLLIP